jgi:hypothetical protein
MKARVEAGTDIAQVGAWDASRDDGAFDKLSFKRWKASLREDTEAGFIFVLNTGADGGGPIDIYINEPIPESALKDFDHLKGEFLVRVPSGKLIVGGVEDYRYSERKITGPNSIVPIPAGDYQLQCHAPKDDEDSFNGVSTAALKGTIGADDYDYWRKRNKTAAFGCLPFALFPAFAYTFNWKIALAITVATAVAWFCCQQQFLKRNTRYQSINKRVQEIYRQAEANAPPTFIFELKRLQEGSNLKGGEVDLC